MSFFGSNEMYDIVKDILHFSKPLLAVLAGFLLVRKINNPNFFIRVVIYISIVFAIKHLIVFGFIDLKRGTIEELRLLAGAGNFIEIIAMTFLIVFSRKKVLNISLSLKGLMILILGMSIVLYFSRTMLVGFIVLLLSFYGYTILSRKAFEYTSIGVILIGVLYAYLFAIDLNPDKPGIENFFYKIKNAPAEVFTSPDSYDRNNHKEIFDQWRGYEAKMALREMEGNNFNYVFGKGFGSLIDLGLKAPIGGENGLQFIPHIHNGYIYVFFKTGIIGLFLYFMIIANLYKKGYASSKNDEVRGINRLISGLGVYFFITSFVITGLYNLEEISIFIVGCFYALSQKHSQDSSLTLTSK
ncbi:MAG: O-antigen ligase family protein [Flavobacteriaceae bacterium]|nr:O-antigen ligase family protein [Flavobacteriaceae bacterium]